MLLSDETLIGIYITGIVKIIMILLGSETDCYLFFSFIFSSTCSHSDAIARGHCVPQWGTESRSY